MSTKLLALGVVALALLMAAPSLSGQGADALDRVIPELEGILDDLETGQVRMTELGQQLRELETVAAEHQSSLAEQSRLVAEYQKTVRELEQHDRQTMEMAQSLKAELDLERTWGRWWIPITATAVVVALVEAVLLVVRVNP